MTASAVGPHGYITLPHLIRLFQEAAMRNTDRLGISSGHLAATEGLTWVLHRQSLEVSRWPRLGERVSVVTLPTRIERQLITHRDFYLLDEARAVLAASASTWSVMDVQSRRIRPLPPAVSGIFGDLGDVFRLAHPTEKPAPPADAPEARSFPVTFAQLDFNNHLTNPAYPELMLEPLGLEFLRDRRLVAADITYHREARYGESVTAVVANAESPHRQQHALYRGKELLAAMVSQWSPSV